MNQLELDNNFFLAKGGERDCYIHPNDSSKIIKVLHTKGQHNNQNELEYIYSNYLKKQNVDFSQITECFGWVDTNKGKGLIFQRVLNYDNSDAKTIRYFVRNHLLKKDAELKMLDELKKYLEKNRILFIDVSLANVFCQEIAKDKYRLVIFDGLGARRTGLKFNLYLKVIPFTKYKIKKQWKKFLYNFNREKKLKPE